MKVKDSLMFSPHFRFNKIDWTDGKNIIEAFEDRIRGYYIYPTRLLNKEKQAFVSTLISASVIDCISRVFSMKENNNGKNYIKWLKNNIEAFNCNSSTYNKSLARLFYENFRNSIVHEGRAKQGFQFDYDAEELIIEKESILILNPTLLVEAIEGTFGNNLDIIKEDNERLASLKDFLIKDFQIDIDYLE